MAARAKIVGGLRVACARIAHGVAILSSGELESLAAWTGETE